MPFLPLEREHVRNCIKAELKNYNITTKAKVNYVISDLEIEQIVDEHVFEPPGYKKYSSSGCKRVPFLVRTFLSRKSYEINDEL